MELLNLRKKILLILAAAVLLMTSAMVSAEEVQYPVPAYTPEELAKVREWEKTWVGKKVDTSNIDQVAQFFPEGFVSVMKDPERWFAPPEGFYLMITPYKPAAETSGVIAATKQYAPTVKTDAEGRITNYTDIAGCPFPNPKTGLELAYNFECNTRGDTYHSRWAPLPNTNPRTRTDRIADEEFWEMFFIHRCDLDPKPNYTDNPKGIHRGQLMHMYLPPEMLNSRLLTVRFIDDSKPDDSYLYYAQFRRIRRLSTAERTNAIDGTDQIYDDGYMWDSPVHRNTYKLIGKKDMLVPRHTDPTQSKRIMGQGMPNNISYERCNMYVVEAVNKDPSYIYKKRVWYIDPETYLILWQEMWDSYGKYWKVFAQLNDDIKTQKGESKNFFTGNIMLDLIRTHTGFSIQKPLGLTVTDIKPDFFTTSNLQKTY